jgi:hypothetical protein
MAPSSTVSRCTLIEHQIVLGRGFTSFWLPFNLPASFSTTSCKVVAGGRRARTSNLLIQGLTLVVQL